ncbi:MAG: hypothetical protein WA118_11690 [Carboxydocellales bacterium]
MKPEPKACPYQFSVEETEEGYAIHVKGDKEKLKARHNRNHGFLSLLHKHIQTFHRGSHPGRESERAD